LRSLPAARAELLALGLVILGGVLLRLYAFDASILNHHFIRQADTAAMTHNFATEGMNILYPRVDWRGASSGIVESEFPLYSFLVAFLYRLFGEHVELARALNLLFFTLTAATLFEFAKRMFDAPTALLAVLLYAFNPVAALFDHSFQPDSMIIFCTIAALTFYGRWCDTAQLTDYLLAAAALALAILVKPFNIYLAAPLFALTLQRYGSGMLSQWRLWLFAVLVLAPSFVWYKYAYGLWLEHGNTLFRAYTDMRYSALWSPDFEFPRIGRGGFSYANVLIWRGIFLWAALGALLPLAWGAILAVRERNWVLIAWGAAFASTGIVLAYQHYAHDYYQWPLVLLCAVLGAHGAMRLWRARSPRLRIAAAALLAAYLAAAMFWSWPQRVPGPYVREFSNSWLLSAYFAAGALLLLGFALIPSARRWFLGAGVAVAVSYGCWTYTALVTPYPFDAPRRAFAARLEALTTPDDRIVIAQNSGRTGWFQHRTAQGELLGYMPVDFYLSHRHGWSVADQYAQPAFIETLRGRGARYVAAFCCEWRERSIAQEFPILLPYLTCAHRPLVVTDRYMIFQLDEPHRRADGAPCPRG
jgi:hypothetical protein